MYDASHGSKGGKMSGRAREANGKTLHLDRETVARAFHGSIAPVPTSASYLLGLVVSAATLITLLAVYFALIAAVAFGVYYHSRYNAGFVFSGNGVVFRLLGFVAPIFAGTFMCLAMIKPLFAKKLRHMHPYSIEPTQEPLLFEFVHAIARAINAPMPHVIEVSIEPNASAAFRRRTVGFFGSNLVLEIGVPLIAGLDTRQLAGVIAHELGHFSQRSGMRLDNQHHLIKIITSLSDLHRCPWR